MISPDLAALAIERGRRADALLHSEEFVETFRDLEHYHVTAMTACAPGPAEADARDHHHRMLHALREVHDQIVGHATAGKEIEDHLSETDDNIEETL